MMHTLAKVGFQQSYTYFTWRNTKQELTDYLTELSGDGAAYLRPNFFVNTPDILHAYLQDGGRPAFEVRAVLAATLSPTWGVYAGYELCESTPVRRGSEEYLDSEKYQLRPRDWDAAEREGRSIAPLITTLNRVRRRHPALQQLRSLHFHRVDNDAVHRVLQTRRTRRRGRHRSHGGQPRPAPHPGGDGVVGHAGTRPRPARVLPGARRAHRRDLPLGQGQLCAP